MKDRFMDEVEFAKFPDEFNVAKHLDLGDGALLLLLRSERVVMFVIDWKEEQVSKQPGNNNTMTPFYRVRDTYNSYS